MLLTFGIRLLLALLLTYFSDYRHLSHARPFNSSYSRVVRASASGAVDSGLVPSLVKLMTLKLVFTASLLDAQRLRDDVKNKPASLRVVPLGRYLAGFPPLVVVDGWPVTPK